MPRILKTKKVVVEGQTIFLKHTKLFSKLSAGSQNNATALIAASRAAARHVVARLALNLPHEKEQTLALALFNTNDTGDYRIIQALTELIHTGLSNNVGLTLSVGKGTCQRNWPGANPEKILGYATNNTSNQIRKGTIHVRQDIVDKITGNMTAQNQALRVFLHEASHKFADTADEFYLSMNTGIADWNYNDAQVAVAGGENLEAKPPKARLMNNADSFGWFISICYLLFVSGQITN